MGSLNAPHAALTTMLSSGLISDQVCEELVSEVDVSIERLSQINRPTADAPEIV